MEDDNGVIIKMKRAGHSLATVKRGGVRLERRYCAKQKRATSYTKFAFYERDRRCIFDSCFFFHFISHSGNTDPFSGSRAISRVTFHASADLRRTINVSLTAGFY